MIALIASKELVLTNPEDGTLSFPIPAGTHFAWADDQAQSIVSHGWATLASVGGVGAGGPGATSENPVGTVHPPHPPHPADEVKG